MESIERYFVNISAPDLVVICIDEDDGEEKGRMYHCYSGEPQPFSSVIELIRTMERFFDSIVYPQASTMTRYFQNVGGRENAGYSRSLPEKVTEQKDIVQYRGKKGTFITHVQYRQNSDWQGQVSCPEQKKVYRFDSTLEFITILTDMYCINN